MILYILISITIALIAKAYFAKTIKTFGLPAKYEGLNRLIDRIGPDQTASGIAVIIMFTWPAITLYIVCHWITILIKER